MVIKTVEAILFDSNYLTFNARLYRNKCYYMYNDSYIIRGIKQINVLRQI